MSDKQKVIQCLHCGNKTLMNNVGEFKKEWDDPENGLFEYRISYMFYCPVCDGITYLESYSNNLMLDWDRNQYEEERIEYPVNSFEDSNLPENIKGAYESALKTKNIDDTICLIAIRKTLEIICKTYNAEGNNLEKKVEDLANKGVIPLQLKNASQLLRLFGNLAVHECEYKADSKDVSALLQFVEYILDYLYIIPKKIERLQDRLKQLKEPTDKN